MGVYDEQWVDFGPHDSAVGSWKDLGNGKEAS
jgi:hypothetical protein